MVVATLSGCGSSVDQPTAAAIRRDFSAAMGVWQGDGAIYPGANVDPGTYPQGSQPALVPPDADALAAADSRSAAGLRGYFTGQQLQESLQEHDQLIAAEGKPDADYVVDGGVTDVDLDKVKVVGDRAHLEGKVTAWIESVTSKGVSDGVAVFRPTGVLDVTADLVENQAGRWQVSSLTWEFEPGEGR